MSAPTDRLGTVTEIRRCAAVVTALVGLSVSGHMLGGGEVPSPVAAGLVVVLAVVLGAVLANRGRPLPTAGLTVVLGAFQGAAHLTFHLVAGHGGLVPTGPAPHGTATVHALPGAHGLARAVTTHGLHQGAAPAPAGVAAAAEHAHALGLSPLMLTSHLLATVMLAWMLGPAVRHVRALVRRATPRVVVPTPALTAPIAFLRPPCLLPRDVVAAVGLRGPPALPCA